LQRTASIITDLPDSGKRTRVRLFLASAMRQKTLTCGHFPLNVGPASRHPSPRHAVHPSKMAVCRVAQARRLASCYLEPVAAHYRMRRPPGQTTGAIP